MIIEFFIQLAEICQQQLLQTVILSPGSRVAPLTLAFVRQPGIHTYTLSDERSAAFTALGLQRQIMSQYPGSEAILPLVGLACTSGSALYNYAPAVAEAYYQEIPLVLFTADRPPEWVNQQDNQTIQQREIYGKHVKGSFETPVDLQHPDALWSAHRMVNEAILLARRYPRGPVHINLPIREPFYPQAEESYTTSSRPPIIQELPSQAQLSKQTWNKLLDIWDESPNKLMVVGQYPLYPDLCRHLELLQKDFKIPIVADIMANMHPIAGLIQQHDTFLLQSDDEFLESLRPDLL
ncbi:MAG: thiamine pyrophosphate-binding protein, partial [Bacteroidota bacterium]